MAIVRSAPAVSTQSMVRCIIRAGSPRPGRVVREGMRRFQWVHGRLAARRTPHLHAARPDVGARRVGRRRRGPVRTGYGAQSACACKWECRSGSAEVGVPKWECLSGSVCACLLIAAFAQITAADGTHGVVCMVKPQAAVRTPRLIRTFHTRPQGSAAQHSMAQQRNVTSR